MIDIQTLTRLKTMRLSGMAAYFENLTDQTGTNTTPSGPEMKRPGFGAASFLAF